MASTLETEVTIRTDQPGLKTYLADLLARTKGHCFGRIEHDDAGLTRMTVQGSSNYLPAYLKLWKHVITVDYWDASEGTVEGEFVTYSDPTPISEERQMDAVVIMESIDSEIKRASPSGTFVGVPEKDLVGDASAATVLADAVSSSSSAFGNGARVATRNGAAHAASVDNVGPFHHAAADCFVDLRHHSLPAILSLDVQSIVDMNVLFETIKKALKLKGKVKALFTQTNHGLKMVSTIREMKAGELYDVYTTIDRLPTAVSINAIAET
jgi:hypothetical protein